MKNYPNVFKLQNLISASTSCSTEIDGKWVPCRPHGFPSIWSRFKLAWMVFTGKGDVVIWPEGQ